MKRCAILLTLLLLVSGAGAAEGPVSRGDFVCALWQMDGSIPSAVPTFTDMGQNDDWAEAVGWAQTHGLVLGDGDGAFSPQRAITREEAAHILRRYYADQGRDTFLPDGVAACNDNEGISPWADDSLYWACDGDLLPWSPGGRLDPQGHLTPDQLATILSQITT